MNTRIKIVIAATTMSLGLATLPASAQGYGVDRGVGYETTAPGYHEDGTLNVFGAHIDPPGARRGGLVGGVVGGVGNAVGGVVGGVTGAADDLVTGSIGGRGVRGDVTGRPVSGYGRGAY